MPPALSTNDIQVKSHQATTHTCCFGQGTAQAHSDEHSSSYCPRPFDISGASHKNKKCNSKLAVGSSRGHRCNPHHTLAGHVACVCFILYLCDGDSVIPSGLESWLGQEQHLLFKHEDFSSKSQHSIKSQVWVHVPVSLTPDILL